MLLTIFWVAVCVDPSAVMAVSNLVKPYYDLDNAENLFKDFIKEHGKVYDGSDYSKRLNIFKDNLKDINRRNEKFPLTVFQVNHLADLRPEERHDTHNKQHLNEINWHSNENIKKMTIPDGPKPAPITFDWRTFGKVSRVKNMEARFCRSSYIFSAIGNIESQYAIKYNKSVNLSEGQSLDCCFHNAGCMGGRPHKLIKDYALRPGIMLEVDYPYHPQRRQCHEDHSKVAVGVIDGILLEAYDEDVLKQKLYEIGPLSACFSVADFEFYREGILEPETCTMVPIPCITSFCALLVGYGAENGTDYWTLKFAYGPEWGEKGYGRIRRGINACYIGKYIATATIH